MAVATVAAASGEDIVPLDMMHTKKTIFQALVDARSRYGGTRQAIVDGDERVVTYDEIMRAVLALGHALKKGTSRIMCTRSGSGSTIQTSRAPLYKAVNTPAPPPRRNMRTLGWCRRRYGAAMGRNSM